MTPHLVADDAALQRLIGMWAEVPRLAVDGEGNGMHAYRSRLCVLQVAWERDGEIEVAIVDPLAVDLAPLAPILSADGPLKVLHDLTFDARMLHEEGIALDHVGDTSVTARFLGETATGLATLVESRLEITLRKAFQKHDWAQRPFTEEHIQYLAGDVVHLFALYDQLTAEAEGQDIGAEIAVECAYKLGTARQAPPERPPYSRVKGYRKLPPEGRAILRALCARREVLAEARDVPPFKIANNALLLTLARKAPSGGGAVRALCRGGARRYADAWRDAIEEGRRDPSPEPPEPTPDRPADWAERKAIEGALNSWRRREAKERGVDLQVVLPGHCMSPLAAALSASLTEDTAPELDTVEGLGDIRIERYAAPWQQVATAALETPVEDAPPAGDQTPAEPAPGS